MWVQHYLEQYTMLFLNPMSVVWMSIWGQAQTQVLQNIEKIQNKAIQILNF